MKSLPTFLIPASLTARILNVVFICLLAIPSLLGAWMPFPQLTDYPRTQADESNKDADHLTHIMDNGTDMPFPVVGM